ncbi:MAG: (d)CMP kinase [Sphingobacteriaceae bacterium]|jgi:cytidylate kinase
MNPNSFINIAIDGYSSCGKSTIAKALAKEIGFTYIDSGAMYRCVTLYFITQNVDLDNLDAVNKALNEIVLDVHENQFLLNGEDVTEAIRSMQISQLVSKVSAIKSVRIKMVALQQAIGNSKNVVMDGRDIGTTVFPGAQLKIFMTADPAVRAKRRFDEIQHKAEKVSLAAIAENLNMRDYEDTHRSESPLRQAEDAIVLDNTFLNPLEQLNFVKDLLSSRQLIAL